MAMRASCGRLFSLARVLMLLLLVAAARSDATPFTDCSRNTGAAGFYQGPVDTTESGVRCMKWSAVPGVVERYPGKGLGDHSFCRNPDGRLRPWCFFLDNSRGRVDWGYCDCKQGSVRLQAGQSRLDGTVEIYLNGMWRNICSDGWNDKEAGVTCRQLGLGEGRAGMRAGGRTSVGPWASVVCVGHETELLQCGSVRNREECERGEKAPLSCSPHAAVLVPVRLSGGGSMYEGRVEVYHAGQWGTVCDDQWDDQDAEVVCRQLGFGGTARARLRSFFGPGSGRVLLDEVRCSGNELSIHQCENNGWGENNCDHTEDAGVSCVPLTDGALRLVGGAKRSEGRLEVRYRGQWGVVCEDGWTHSNTQVVCRQLGFRSGKSDAVRGFGAMEGQTLLDDVSCTGKEPSLSHCRRTHWIKHNCSNNRHVSVACETQLHTHSKSVDVRLVGGESEREGRVEVMVGGRWGTVCDDGWSDQNAEVVCRQLGYRGPARARGLAYFGEGSGPILLDNVKCSGSERFLDDCVKQPLGTHNCRHSEDAGVICQYRSQRDDPEVKGLVGSVCGVTHTHTRHKRIIGGQSSLRGGWPWQAAVRLRGSRGEGRLVCGATLISSCWILTSAHCFKRYGNSTGLYKVRVGDHHAQVPEEHEQEYGVERLVLHPRYRPSDTDHDLALLRLSGPRPGQCARLGPAVLPACLPARRERVSKLNCYITGWGDTGRSYSQTLQQASISVLSRRQCQQLYPQHFTSRMLCAGSAHSAHRVDSCRGDSGGPLVCQRPSSGQWVLYGVTSWGHACRLQDAPGVYTKVSAFVPWIQKVIGQSG